MWDNTAVGTESCWTIQLLEQRDVGLYSCGNRERNIKLWDYTVVATQRNIEMWDYTAVGT